MDVTESDGAYKGELWRERIAAVSPHRAQNAAIRNALPPLLRANAFVETVDRIQGKERDAVVLSYCVADSRRNCARSGRRVQRHIGLPRMPPQRSLRAPDRARPDLRMVRLARANWA